jgi:hypothetical protein
MPLLNAAAKIMVGSTPAVAVYAGATKVWPAVQPPTVDVMHAQDDAEHRVMIWDHYWADVPGVVRPLPRNLEVILSPVYRAVSNPGARVTWIDAESASHDIFNAEAVPPHLMTESELIALVDAASPLAIYMSGGRIYIEGV